jgi:hypothetical protein
LEIRNPKSIRVRPNKTYSLLLIAQISFLGW